MRRNSKVHCRIGSSEIAVERAIAEDASSLPHRQLRNMTMNAKPQHQSSLPHRQLRKVNCTVDGTYKAFTAA